MAALDNAAVMFASRSNNGQPSTIVYRPLASWAPNSEWQVQLDKGEEAEAVALGRKFAVIATSLRHLRILSHTGCQRSMLSFAGACAVRCAPKRRRASESSGGGPSHRALMFFSCAHVLCMPLTAAAAVMCSISTRICLGTVRH